MHRTPTLRVRGMLLDETRAGHSTFGATASAIAKPRGLDFEIERRLSCEDVRAVTWHRWCWGSLGIDSKVFRTIRRMVVPATWCPHAPRESNVVGRDSPREHSAFGISGVRKQIVVSRNSWLSCQPIHRPLIHHPPSPLQVAANSWIVR